MARITLAKRLLSLTDDLDLLRFDLVKYLGMLLVISGSNRGSIVRSGNTKELDPECFCFRVKVIAFSHIALLPEVILSRAYFNEVALDKVAFKLASLEVPSKVLSKVVSEVVSSLVSGLASGLVSSLASGLASGPVSRVASVSKSSSVYIGTSVGRTNSRITTCSIVLNARARDRSICSFLGLPLDFRSSITFLVPCRPAVHRSRRSTVPPLILLLTRIRLDLIVRPCSSKYTLNCFVVVLE